MNTKQPIEELREQKKANADKILELSASIGVWLNTAEPEIREWVNNVGEYVEYRMVELEVQGQEEKIKQMRDVLKKLKNES
jgi:hypothetical protein